MIVDTSALVAILLQEVDAPIYTAAIQKADLCRMSAGTFVEVALVLEGQFGTGMLHECDAFIRSATIVIEPLSVEQAHTARQAFHDFGKGRHPAGLNFGDCFAYALAKSTREPLLFKGRDFSKTDVTSAL